MCKSKYIQPEVYVEVVEIEANFLTQSNIPVGGSTDETEPEEVAPEWSSDLWDEFEF